MDITFLYFDDCPHWQQANTTLARALTAEGLEARISYRTVTTEAEAARFGFVGSPTILVDGEDRFAAPGQPTGLTCRIYDTPAGPAGSPTVDQLRAALS